MSSKYLNMCYNMAVKTWCTHSPQRELEVFYLNKLMSFSRCCVESKKRTCEDDDPKRIAKMIFERKNEVPEPECKSECVEEEETCDERTKEVRFSDCEADSTSVVTLKDPLSCADPCRKRRLKAHDEVSCQVGAFDTLACEIDGERRKRRSKEETGCETSKACPSYLYYDKLASEEPCRNEAWVCKGSSDEKFDKWEVEEASCEGSKACPSYLFYDMLACEDPCCEKMRVVKGSYDEKFDMVEREMHVNFDPLSCENRCLNRTSDCQEEEEERCEEPCKTDTEKDDSPMSVFNQVNISRKDRSGDIDEYYGDCYQNKEYYLYKRNAYYDMNQYLAKVRSQQHASTNKTCTHDDCNKHDDV